MIALVKEQTNLEINLNYTVECHKMPFQVSVDQGAPCRIQSAGCRACRRLRGHAKQGDAQRQYWHNGVARDSRFIGQREACGHKRSHSLGSGVQRCQTHSSRHANERTYKIYA